MIGRLVMVVVGMSRITPSTSWSLRLFLSNGIGEGFAGSWRSRIYFSGVDNIEAIPRRWP